jgi:hypothetical protein
LTPGPVWAPSHIARCVQARYPTSLEAGVTVIAPAAVLRANRALIRSSVSGFDAGPFCLSGLGTVLPRRSGRPGPSPFGWPQTTIGLGWQACGARSRGRNPFPSKTDPAAPFPRRKAVHRLGRVAHPLPAISRMHEHTASGRTLGAVCYLLRSRHHNTQCTRSMMGSGWREVGRERARVSRA